MARNDYNLAITDSSKVINSNNTSDDDYWTRGQAYAALGEKVKALTDYKRCLALTENYEKYDANTHERNDLVRQEIAKIQ